MLKRYLLFTFDVRRYHDGSPLGGWDDFAGSYETVTDIYNADIFANLKQDTCYQIVDSQTGEIIES